MKVLLRNRKTNLYVRGEAEWTLERNLARDFGQSGHAARFVLDKRLHDMEAVLSFRDPRYDLFLTLCLKENAHLHLHFYY